MKYLKNFENRRIRFEYLDKVDTILVENFIRGFIGNLPIIKNVDKLKFVDFINNDFEYFRIFESNFLLNYYNYIYNIYYEIDRFLKDKDSFWNKNYKAPALKNTIHNIIKKIYKEYVANGYKDKLDKKLIKILEKNPEKYEKIFEIYGKYFNKSVKDGCEWMLKFKTYNL